MNVREFAVLFDCEGEQLVGIVATPRLTIGDVGVLVVVGGPQYRAGSHRQFVLLARYLANQGWPCMRFDYRGMGDSTGGQRDFEDVNADIRAAVDTFIAQSPSVKRVVLWGLCDGASASCFYAPLDSRIAGLVLLNPWVRTAEGDAKVMLKHYYRNRFLSADFWKKFLGGGVSVVGAIKSFVKTARQSRAPMQGCDEVSVAEQPFDLPRRLAERLNSANRPFVVILSGRDFVASEFEHLLGCNADWKRLMVVGELERIDEADHTFSRAVWRERAERLSGNWIARLSER